MQVCIVIPFGRIHLQPLPVNGSPIRGSSSSCGGSATNTKSPVEPFPTWMIHAPTLAPPLRGKLQTIGCRPETFRPRLQSQVYRLQSLPSLPPPAPRLPLPSGVYCRLTYMLTSLVHITANFSKTPLTFFPASRSVREKPTRVGVNSAPPFPPTPPRESLFVCFPTQAGKRVFRCSPLPCPESCPSC